MVFDQIVFNIDSIQHNCSFDENVFQSHSNEDLTDSTTHSYEKPIVVTSSEQVQNIIDTFNVNSKKRKYYI